MRAMKRRVDENSYSSHSLNVFKINKREEGSQPFFLFGCFKNYDENERKRFKWANLPLFENGLATLAYD